MQEIKCPHCGKVFQVDESGYDQIVRQVRDREFEKELARREQEMERTREHDRSLERMEREKQQSELAAEKERALAEKDRELEALRARLNGAETARQLAVVQAVQEKEKELSDRATRIAELEGQLAGKDSESKYKEASLRQRYEEQLRLKDDQIEYYKDFKARQSTKMVGESLEQHCQTQRDEERDGRDRHEA